MGHFQTARGPVDGVGLGQPPFQRPVPVIHLFHEDRVHFIHVGEQVEPLEIRGRLRMQERVEIGPAVAKYPGHLGRPLLLVVHVGVIEIVAHLVLKEPTQLAVKQGLVGVVVQALVAQQRDAAFNPAPAVLGVLELDRDVVGHVPGLEKPDLREVRFQLGNPVGQLGHLKKFVLLLQFVGAHPERVRDQTAKAAQGHRGKRQHGRRVFQRRHPRQSQPVAVLVQRALHRHQTGQQSGGQQEQHTFFQARIHCVPWAVASSRR
ncbi:MAG: hypothetical protein BWX84_02601 [Verrucomicrobia bacterium ADurb.Bin118]|nr:MAG: hypothetical protein BWX84_02601 [Verrucomicrobia bacterium ADurb.Bin118]